MLKQQIKSDSNDALKSGDQFTCGVLRMALAAINAKEKDKRYKALTQKPELTGQDLEKESELSDDQVIDVVSSEIKKRKDAIALYQQGNRPELADNEKKEIVILQKYLPEQLSEEALRALIQESIKKTGAKEIKDMGKIMADLMPKVKGKADNSQISNIVKQILSV